MRTMTELRRAAVAVAAIALATIPIVHAAAPTAGQASPRRVTLHLGKTSIPVLGLSWRGAAVVGEIDPADAATDRALRAVSLAVPASSRGSFVLPNPDEEVRIEFLEGDPDRPLVIGLLRSKVDRVAPGGDDNGTRWIAVRITFESTTRSKGSIPSSPVRASAPPAIGSSTPRACA